MLAGIWLIGGVAVAVVLILVVRTRASKAKAAAEWTRLHALLSNRQIPRQSIAHTIVMLGKPFDKDRIYKAKDAVLQHRDHEDAWIRHEVLWFVGSWGRLQECLPILIHAMHNDPFEDNRAYAARSIGTVMRGTQDSLAIKELLSVLKNQSEKTTVRLDAYRGLLLTVKGESAEHEANHFPWSEKDLSDVDWHWVSHLESLA